MTDHVRSHEEIYNLIAEALGKAREAEQAAGIAVEKAKEAVGNADAAYLVVQRVEGKIDDLIQTIGSEGFDDHGVRIGTGIVGRLMRVEACVAKRFGLYDAWLRFAAGVAAAVSVAAAVFWWLLSERIAMLFKGAP